MVTGCCRLNGTILLRSEGTAENPTDNGALRNSLGQRFDDGKTEDSLARQKAIVSTRKLNRLDITDSEQLLVDGGETARKHFRVEGRIYLRSEKNSGFQTEINVS